MRVLDVAKAHMRQFNENGVVHVDCQRSAMNAFRRTFGCKVKVCLFHINQALWRFVQGRPRLGIQQHEQTTPSFVGAEAHGVPLHEGRKDDCMFP